MRLHNVENLEVPSEMLFQHSEHQMNNLESQRREKTSPRFHKNCVESENPEHQLDIREKIKLWPNLENKSRSFFVSLVLNYFNLHSQHPGAL